MSQWIIRHYWDEKVGKNKANPLWLTYEDDKLTEEQKTIKRLYISAVSRKAELSKKKIKYEKIDGFHIRYEFLTKEDPFNTDDKKRMVTEFTMIVNSSKTYAKSLQFLLFLVLTMALAIGIYKITNKKEEKSNVILNVEKQVTEKIQQKKKQKKHMVVKEKFNICNFNESLNIKRDDKQTECLQSYLTKYCSEKNPIKSSFVSYYQLPPESQPLECLNIKTINYKQIQKKNNSKFKIDDKDNIIKFLKGDF